MSATTLKEMEDAANQAYESGLVTPTRGTIGLHGHNACAMGAAYKTCRVHNYIGLNLTFSEAVGVMNGFDGMRVDCLAWNDEVEYMAGYEVGKRLWNKWKHLT